MELGTAHELVDVQAHMLQFGSGVIQRFSAHRCTSVMPALEQNCTHWSSTALIGAVLHSLEQYCTHRLALALEC